MSDGVRETPCTCCVHRTVCTYRDNFLKAIQMTKAINYDLETIMQMNVDKLRARYPDGFDTEHSLHRAKNDI